MGSRDRSPSESSSYAQYLFPTGQRRVVTIPCASPDRRLRAPASLTTLPGQLGRAIYRPTSSRTRRMTPSTTALSLPAAHPTLVARSPRRFATAARSLRRSRPGQHMVESLRRSRYRRMARRARRRPRTRLRLSSRLPLRRRTRPTRSSGRAAARREEQGRQSIEGGGRSRCRANISTASTGTSTRANPQKRARRGRQAIRQIQKRRTTTSLCGPSGRG